MEDLPRCPTCNTDFNEWWEDTLLSKGKDGDQSVLTCGECEKDFKTTLSVTYSFESEKLSWKD